MHSFFPLVEAFFNIFPRFWFSTYKRWRDDSGSREPFFFFFFFTESLTSSFWSRNLYSSLWHGIFLSPGSLTVSNSGIIIMVICLLSNLTEWVLALPLLWLERSPSYGTFILFSFSEYRLPWLMPYLYKIYSIKKKKMSSLQQ